MRQRTLDCASVEWRDGRTPVSQHYGDLYFSAEDGCAESRHVFLANNDLPQRMREWQHPLFTIAETGFGTGLNFLLAWQLWKSCHQPGQRLRYLSAERHPLEQGQMEKAHACWPELAREATLLDRHYPPPTAGIHTIHLSEEVELVLLLDDATAGFGALSGVTVDAWFLDGFAPAKNPEMWKEELFQTMARLSYPGTTLASFTAAGAVRRGLAAAGFSIRKVPGYGRKREMIRGVYRGKSET
jgi:tRNA 5-methylaminomethyl-2-thiouridine biosynthesis bifunctional protein